MSGAPTCLQYLEALAKTHEELAYRRTPHQFLLEHGRAFEPAELPRGVKLGPVKLCYQNAFNLALARPDKYTYVEGIAYHLIPTEHAWCVDGQGRVVDNTWRSTRPDDDPLKWEYFGIPIRIDYAFKVVQSSKLYSVLWNYDAKWPMLRDDPSEWRVR